jgi:hypothetical protein
METDKAKKNQSARNLQAKRGFELLIEHSQPEERNGK